jgi:hypothetical protein|tara:strand:+ start:17 stop:430 length:414 start_codon:yes stop_codon:yes gene_type:complete
MPFLGRSPDVAGKNNVLLDAISASATATYNLTKDSVAYAPVGAASLIVSLNGVTQAPINGYTVSGTQLIFASALTSNDVIDYIISSEAITKTVAVPDGAVSTSKLADSSVTAAKLSTTLANRLTALEDENLLNLGVL